MALLDTTAVSERIKYSVRSVQGVALILKIPKVKGSYLFTEEQATQIETYLRSKNEKITPVDEARRVLDDELITETFTPEQYEVLQEVIQKYTSKTQEIKHLLDSVSSYENQIHYLRDSLKNKDDQMTELIKSFNKIVTTLSERNWIELNEKNLSTPANKKQGKN
jgi:predicted nucleic acid-binding protein